MTPYIIEDCLVLVKIYNFCIHIDIRRSMRGKTITISLEAYEVLLRERGPSESFSEVILRLVKSRDRIMDLAGAWRELNDGEIRKVFRDIRMKWSWRETWEGSSI